MVDSQVNFCAWALPTVTMCHEDAAALAVLGGVLRNGYLHTAIREKGGAYGAGATHDSSLACFKFYSYRDPRVEGTFKDFAGSVDWVLNKASGDAAPRHRSSPENPPSSMYPALNDSSSGHRHWADCQTARQTEPPADAAPQRPHRAPAALSLVNH